MTTNWEWKEHFIFLGMLRESGVTNMLGASPYLVKHCDLDRRTAKKVLINWLENYDKISKELNK